MADLVAPEKLASHKCEPCEGGVDPLTREEFSVYLPQVPGWGFREDDAQMFKEFIFKNFAEALEFVNKVGSIAEAEGHHPDIHLTAYKKVKIELMTHAIEGLSINDFVLAVKIEQLFK